VNQCKVVKNFHGMSRNEGVFRISTAGPGTNECEQWTDAFSAQRHDVVHGLVQSAGTAGKIVQAQVRSVKLREGLQVAQSFAKVKEQSLGLFSFLTKCCDFNNRQAENRFDGFEGWHF
jgi:hypothetical protein